MKNVILIQRLDILLLLLLVPAHIVGAETPFLLVVPLLLYLLLEIGYPLGVYPVLPEGWSRVKILFMLRLVLLLLIIARAVFIPAVEKINDRFALTAADGPCPPEIIEEMHDGALQTEYALQYLSQKQNPYAESYKNTTMDCFGFWGMEAIYENPALENLVYFPGLLVSSFPVYALFQWLNWPYDQRIVYLLAYFVFILSLPLLADAPVAKLTLLAAVGLNPFLTGPVVAGMNDIVVLLCLLIVVLCLKQRRLFLSAMAFGIACAIKQLAWFIAPFYLLYVYGLLPPDKRWRKLFQLSLVVGLMLVLITGPFAYWGLGDLWQDTIVYPGGGAVVNYPIRGYTVGVLLVALGNIPSAFAPYPFWILQLIFGLPLLTGMLRYQWRANTLGTMWVSAGMFLFGMGFVSRFFQNNYVGFLLTLMMLGFLLNFFAPVTEEPL